MTSAAARPPLRIALTGASGFLGSAILRELLAAGHHVRLLSRGNLPARDGTTLIPGALDQPEALARLVEGSDIVIHCAGLTGAWRIADFHRVNADGTARLAAAALKAGVPRFLLISSLAAREPQLSPYAASKAAAEAALAAIPGLAWDALRPPAIYGPGDLHMLSLFRPLTRGLAITPGGPDARASVIHVEDCASAVLAWIDGPSPAGRAYELDDGAGGRTWRQLLGIAAGLLGKEPRYVTPPHALQATLAAGASLWGRLTRRPPFLSAGKLRELRHADWSADARPFQQATGWQPRFSFEEGLRETFAWYCAHGHL